MRSDSYGDVQSVLTQVGVGPDDIDFGTHASLEQYVEKLLGRASQEIDDYTGRPLVHEEGRQEAVDGTGRETLKLNNYPVLDVQSIQVGNSTLDPEHYRADRSGIVERRGRWPDGWGNITVVYDWGYPDGHGTAETVAEEMVITALQRAVIENQSNGMSSVSMDGYSVSYDDVSRQVEMADEHKERLKQVAEVSVA